jgi:hypothetical protein
MRYPTMSSIKKNGAKVKDLPKKPVSTRKAGGVKGGRTLQPYPRSVTLS